MPRRIDTHVHMVPADYRAELDRRSLLTYPLPPSSRELLEGLMARHEIDAAVVSLSPPGVWFGDPALAGELARIVNERTAELVASDPSRFAGLAVLPLPDLERALAELAYALDVLELDGVALLSNVGGIYQGDASWDPVWAELERRGAYVMLHPSAPTAPPPLPHHPIWLYEYPFDTTRAVVNLIYSGTIDRSPSVRLQVAHLGGTATFLGHRIASLREREPEKATLARQGALSALATLYYDTGLANNASQLAAARSIVPLDRIVFGTDWPYAALPASGDPAPELAALDAADRIRIDGVNAGALVPRLFRT
jgi:predicted TIM-barrel fold metal-dependent hydrolase